MTTTENRETVAAKEPKGEVRARVGRGERRGATCEVRSGRSGRTADNPNERLLRFLQATPEQQAAIDRVLAGEVPAAPAKAPTGPLLLGMSAGAALLGVSRATLWRMIKIGRLARVEVLPGSFRVRRQDVEAIAGPDRTGQEAGRA